jgi:uncharacterized protein YegP (UPF0339 family)
MPHFTIQLQESGTWFYQLISSKGHLLLTGNKHEYKQSCHGEILSVRLNSLYTENYEILQTPENHYYFTLRSMGSEKTIGTSEKFPNRENCQKIINIIKKGTENAEIKATLTK